MSKHLKPTTPTRAHRRATQEPKRIKSKSSYRIKLYSDTDAKLHRQVEREGGSCQALLCRIVEDYFHKRDQLPDELRRQEELTGRLADLLGKYHESVSEQLTTLQHQLSDDASRPPHGGAADEGFDAGIAELKGALATQRVSTNLLLNLGVEIALRVMSAEHFLLHYLADPHLAEHAEHLTAPQVLNSIEQPEKHLSAAAIALQSRLHQTHRQGIRASLQDARKQMESDPAGAPRAVTEAE